MIAIDANHLPDGLYQVHEGQIWKYKGKGGQSMKYGIIELHDNYDFSTPIAHKELVMCENCRKSHIDGKTTHHLWCTEWGRSTDTFGYCERGE